MACWRRGLTHQPFTLAFTGSNPVHVIPGRLAQLGERLPYKQNVGGSIPSTPMLNGVATDKCRVGDTIFLYKNFPNGKTNQTEGY